MKRFPRLLKMVSIGLVVLSSACGQRGPAKAPDADQPDGKLVDGVRIITLSTDSQPGNLYVYRGEEVRLVINRVDFPYSVHIPMYGISKAGELGKALEVEFKAAQAGVFPMFCNGKCPTGDGQRFAQIVVMEFQGEDAMGTYRNVNTKEAMAVIGKEKPLLLDVRTPNEFHEGHLEGAWLIPVQQLAFRIGELEEHRDKPILVYCRSGNRSIPASQILMEKGFKKVYNLSGGIREWIREGGKVVNVSK